jgi:hypothetical protein
MLTPPLRPAASFGPAAVLLAFVIWHLPALGVGLTADDLWWALSLQGGEHAAPFELNYTVAEDFWRDRGVGFWWTSPDLRWTLARPLAGALFAALIPVFDPRAWAWQGLGIVGTLGLVTTSWPLFRRLLGDKTALVALALFAAHPAHVQLVWFVSTHHAWMGAIPALLGLVAWIRWRVDGWAPGLWLAPLGVVVGLASSETALGVLPYAAAFEWVTRRPGWRGAIGGVGALFVGYTALHTALGFGVEGSALYLDPRVDPLGAAWGVLSRGPVLLFGAFAPLPADLWLTVPALRPVLVALGLGGAALVALGLRRAWPTLSQAHRDAAQIGILGALLGLPLFTTAAPGGRLVLWMSLGSVMVLALLFGHAWTHFRTAGARRALLPLAPLFLGALGGALMLPPQLRVVAGVTEELRLAAEHAEWPSPMPPDTFVLVLTLPDAATALTLIPARLLADGGAAPERLIVLSASPTDHRLERLSDDTLTLSLASGRLWDQPMERLFLHPADLHQRVNRWDREGLRVTRLDDDPQAGPRALSFTFDPPLSDRRWRVFTWADGALRAVNLPAPGEGHDLPWSPGPLPAPGGGPSKR